MAIANTLYNVFVQRNSIYVGTILTGAFVFGIGFDTATQIYWDKHNQGKQWKDIRQNYIKEDDE